MAFLNVSLLLGGALFAIPVVLHLIMRQKPKHLVFPALRFVKERRQSNTRRLQLRHWLLLALRCAAILVPALALARPSVSSALWGNYLTLGTMGLAFAAVLLFLYVAAVRKLSRYLIGGLALLATLLGAVILFTGIRALIGGKPVLGDQEAPVAAVLVIDTSPRMEFRQENKRRLEVAQETAAWLIKQLPGDSEVAVVDSRPGAASFAIDRTAAEKAIERLRATGTPRPLVEVLAAAIQLVEQKQQARKEIYVLSDLTEAAWKTNQPAEIQKTLTDHPQVQLYVIDVGSERPKNFSLGDLQLSSQILPPEGQLVIETQVRSAGVGGSKTVELLLEQPDPTLPIIRNGKVVLPTAQLRGQETVQLEPGGSQQVKFVVKKLPSGSTQGTVRLVGEDGLALDDVRHFAIEVQPDWPVLIVAPPGVKTKTHIVALQGNTRAKLQVTAVPQEELISRDFSSYRAICIMDPLPVSADVWEKLAAYAEKGNGIAILLGHNAQPLASFQEEAAAKVLGGKLTRQTRSGGDLYLAPSSYDHPILAPFREIEANVPWNDFPVYYHWNLDDLAPSARSILPFGNNKPALVENRLGRGKVLVMTTPLTDPLQPRGRPCWNELWFGSDPWPGFMLWNEMLVYLVGTGEVRLNYHTGETAVLTNDPAVFPERYQLFTPLDEPVDVLARDERVTVRFTDNPGAYRLRGQRGGPLVRGFAVNLPADLGDLTRLPKEKLEDLLGKDRFQFARSRDEINRAVGADRIGSEFYPLLITLLALVLGLEQTLANRFYKDEGGVERAEGRKEDKGKYSVLST
ncbi:MAG: BatA domain-containing protein [Planctomycetales bacterium]|nr:BatA domain-containing protein [Planctomycetales bacterium]